MAALFAGAGDVPDNGRSRAPGGGHRRAGTADGARAAAPTGRGAPEHVTDTIEERFRSNAADGCSVMPPYHPGGSTIFADAVVPILRARELFRTEYTGHTLRDHFGLPRPVGRRTEPAISA